LPYIIIDYKGAKPPYQPPKDEGERQKLKKTKTTEEKRAFLSGALPPYNPQKAKQQTAYGVRLKRTIRG